MSTPVAPHSLAVYKLVREYEKSQKTVHTQRELLDFSLEALKEAQKISGEKYWLLFGSEEYLNLYYKCLSEFCDITCNHVVFNPDKYNANKYLVAERISNLSDSLIKGADIALENMKNKKQEVFEPQRLK